jgi:hypothetical protein
MTLPDASDAVVDIRKLRDYCLSLAHPRGKHKARVFESALGFTANHAEQLRQRLLEAAHHEAATRLDTDEYGTRYQIDATLNGPAGAARVRSIWIVRSAEAFPRLVTCYVLE